ncbi:Translation initiation factor SUI1 family protein [Prunus dulcis]|uniref:Translation initiation factor SUI1 family protein n=1 Tax=Prunus dulcis TaxID=3755 RepID=A0A4Y1RWY6_PRUDU|nr:Translation initiation factor SUI1 family protein [Prunus dulcis]
MTCGPTWPRKHKQIALYGEWAQAIKRTVLGLRRRHLKSDKDIYLAISKRGVSSFPITQRERKTERGLRLSSDGGKTPTGSRTVLCEANAKEADKVANQLQSTGISSGGDGAASSAPKQEEVKRLPGGKIKKKERQEVTIEKMTRNKRKCITTVKGLELFGVKLSDASKKLGKKFATGASVVKGPTEKDQIDVPEAAIFFIEDGRKVPAA